MTATTLPGVLLSGTHAGRPAASAVAAGALYAETDTGQTYQSDGASTWTAWGAAAGAAAFMGASAWNSVTQNVLDATNVLLTFDSENYDTNAIHSPSVNPTRFTVPTGGAGYWMAKGYLVWDTNTGGQFRYCWWMKNGTRIPSSLVMSPPNSSGTDQQNVLQPILLADGDYIEFEVYQNSGGTRVVGASSGDQRVAATVWRVA